MVIAYTANCPDCGIAHTTMGNTIKSIQRCSKCSKEAEIKTQKTHFNRLDSMTIIERVRRIEEWIYNYKPPIDIWNTPIG